MRPTSVEEKVESGVFRPEYPDDACWPWQRATDSEGYGIVMRKAHGRWSTTRAHRLAYEVWTGKTLPKGWPLRHECDNPPCCRPSHLVPGSQLQNVADMVSRRRQALGEKNGNAVLRSSDVSAIKKMLLSGSSQDEIAGRFRISQSHVAHIKRGSIWRHIA